MNALKKEKKSSTKVEEKSVVKNVTINPADEIIKSLEDKFAALANIETRLKKVEERMGL